MSTGDVCCPLCGGGLTGPLVKGMLHCVSCGCFRQAVIPSPKLLKEQGRAMMLGACSNPAKKKERMQRASYQVDLLEQHLSPGLVYDVGAAAGFFMKVARDRGWKVQGNEISKKAIAWAKEHYQLDIDYGLLPELDPPKGCFDAVVLWNTLEHVIDPCRTTELCVAMLRSGGVLLLDIPDKDERELIKHPEKKHLTEFNHVNLPAFFERKGLRELMLKKYVAKSYVCMELMYQKV